MDRTRASSSPTMLPYQLDQPDLPSPLPQGGELICTVLNFFCLYPNINLKLPHQGSNPCLILFHHAALLTRPTRSPLPLSPRWRGHMYFTPFPNFLINIYLHLPPLVIESMPPRLPPRCLINNKPDLAILT